QLTRYPVRLSLCSRCHAKIISPVYLNSTGLFDFRTGPDFG
ncbi:MAG: hypothetical protein ACI9WU_002145, partial [Myxococcota bacterium]